MYRLLEVNNIKAVLKWIYRFSIFLLLDPALAILHLFTKFSLTQIYFLFGSSFLALINVKTLPVIANMYTVNMDGNLFRGLLNTANRITFVT